MAESSTSSILLFRCASTYSCTRRIAAGDRPPRACGADASDVRLARISERGRVCRPGPAAFCQVLKFLSGCVSNAGQASSVPATTSRVCDIGGSIAPEKRAVLFDYVPQAEAGAQLSIVEQEERA